MNILILLVLFSILQLSLLSPSLFSLHNEGRGLEKTFSIPNLANSLNSSDYKEWLNFIVEASGVSDSVDEMKKVSLFIEAFCNLICKYKLSFT